MRTRVVSWNDAAEMKESVARDALVIPSTERAPNGRLATIGLGPLVLQTEAEFIHLLVQQEIGVAHVFNFDPSHHLTRNHFDVLVIDVDALQTVDFLDFVHQVLLQFLLAQHRQDIVRIARAVHQRLTRLDALAFLNGNVHAAGQQVFLGLALIRNHQNLALTLHHVA